MSKLQKVWSIQSKNTFEVFADENQYNEALKILSMLFKCQAAQGYFITKEQLREVALLSASVGFNNPDDSLRVIEQKLKELIGDE